MNRLALGLVLALLLSACSFGEESEPGGANDAQTFKERMDAQARQLLPALRDAYGGGTLKGMEARFHEKGGNLGVWAYTADGLFEGPFPEDDDVLAASRSVLEEQGFDVTADTNGDDLAARQDGILVTITRVPAPDGAGTARLAIAMVSDDGLSSRDDYAENAAPEDYAALAR